jgi:hypothetical protein
LLSSEEFQGKYKVMHPGTSDHPALSMERETPVFIQLQKTGRTSLRAMLEGNFRQIEDVPSAKTNCVYLRLQNWAGTISSRAILTRPADLSAHNGNE